MVGRPAVQRPPTEEEQIELERKARELKALRRKFQEGDEDVIKERPVSKIQLKKQALAEREAELKRQYEEEQAQQMPQGAA